MDEQTPQGPAKRAKNDPGPSRITVTGDPQQVPVNQDLLVLPPIPRDIIDELTAQTNDGHGSATEPDDGHGSTTEPETSEDEIQRRKLSLKK